MSRLTTVMFADWIRPLLTSGARVVAGRLPEMPNRVVGITKNAGAGLEMEGLFDVIGINVQCRGGENHLADAESIAGEVDDIFLGKHPLVDSENFLIGTTPDDVFVSAIGRYGGEPNQLTITDPLSRFTFTCSYFAYVSTNVGTVFNG